MSNRWNTRKIITDAPKPPLKIYVPADCLAPTSITTDHPAGFRVRTRGDTGGTVKHEYRCPVHGVFEAMVPRAAVPDEVPCRMEAVDWHRSDDGPLIHTGPLTGPVTGRTNRCGVTSPWAGSSCGIGISSGMVRS